MDRAGDLVVKVLTWHERDLGLSLILIQFISVHLVSDLYRCKKKNNIFHMFINQLKNGYFYAMFTSQIV